MTRKTYLPLALTVLLLAACGEKEPVDSAVDADGDGFTEEEDCDDGDAAVNPGATEACDGIDNNCDGAVDEGLHITVYNDRDGDGYGVAAQASEACAAEAGQSEEAGDCNDSSADIYPGAPEEDCTDPVDYNCDGVVEFEDNDSDGYAACVDCDDANSTIHPDADELCDNVDNNCDGEVDEASAVDASTFYADLDLDGYGDADNSTVACDAPSGYVADSTDCDDAADTVYPGAPELCDAADTDCDGVIGEVLVPSDYSSIQAAIDAGEPEICVEAGTYSENLVATVESDLTLEGVGVDQVFLDGGGAGRVVDVTGSAARFTLANLTVQSGWADDSYAGGLSVQGDGTNSVSVQDVVFTDNVCEGSVCYGAAVTVNSYDQAELVDVEAYGNTLYGQPYGSLSFNTGERLTLDGVSIHDELASVNSGGGFASALLVQNTFTDSSTGYWGSVLSINDLEIYDNEAVGASTVYSPATFYRIGELDITNASVTGNSIDTGGFCVTPTIFPFSVHTGSLRNIELVGNSCTSSSDVYAGGFWAYGTTTAQGSRFDVENMIVAGNSVETDGFLYSGWVLEYYTDIHYTNVSVYGNSATGDTSYAAWTLLGDVNVTMTNVDVSGNSLNSAGTPAYATGFGQANSDTTLSVTYSNLADLGDTPFDADLTDPTGSNGVISVSPGYTDVSDADPLSWDLTLGSGSDLIDAGDPSIADPDGSISDIGAYGGPGAADW